MQGLSSGGLEGGALPQLNDNNRFSVFEDTQKFRNKSVKPQTAKGKRILQGGSSGQQSHFSPRKDLKQPNFMVPTNATIQRVNNVGLPEHNVNLSFETRIKDLANVKDQTSKLNPKVIETWINETLLDAEHLDIPGVVLKPEHKNPVSRYQIDRLSLTNAGITNEQVDRIYRGLFVYSIGFYEMLQRSLHHCEHKYLMLSSIWKVFAILLEYCCKSNYQMLISKLSRDHKEELERLEQEFTNQVNRLSKNEKQLKETLDEVQKRKDELFKQKEEESFLRKKLEEEFTKNVQTHEEEVQLRLKFESKLNNMHALHRDLQAKYQRALEDIYSLEGSNHSFSKVVQQQKSELIELRSEKVENESKIVYQTERIKQLIQENELKLRQMNDMEIKYSKVNAEMETKSMIIKTMEKQVNDMRLKVEANGSLIDGLTSEKNHIELSLKENRDQKEQYKEKSERLQEMHESVFREMQEYKQQLVGIQEIKKDRDDRIEKLREEYEQVAKKYDQLDREYTGLKVQHEHVSEEQSLLKVDFDTVTENLKVANRVRNEKEDALADKIKMISHMIEQIKDKDYQVDKLRKEVEKLHKRIGEVERQNDLLEIKKKSLDKQSEIQRKQLLDKIQNLNELVSAEKDTREMWINRFEKEQKAHIQTNSDLLTARSQHQDALMKAKNLEISISSLTKSRDAFKAQNEELQRQLGDFMGKNESVERDLYTKTELLKAVEEQQRELIRKIKEENIANNIKNTQDLYCKDIEYEDLRSYIVQVFDKYTAQQLVLEVAQADLSSTKYSKEKLEAEVSKHIEEYEDLTQRYGVSQEKLTASEHQAKEFEYQNVQLQTNIESLNEEVMELQKACDEMHLLQKENQMLIDKIQLIEAQPQINNDKMSSIGTTIDAARKTPSSGVGTFYNRGIQTKKPKQKEKEVQTEQQYLQQQQNMMFMTNQSTLLSNHQSQKKPRIASAANTTSTVMQSGHQMIRDNSQGFTSTLVNSQGDLHFIDYNAAIGSSYNISEHDRAIKSAAQQFRHRIPISEAIEEEQEQRVSNSGMFKRNSIAQQQEDDESIGDQRDLRKTPTDYQLHHRGIGGTGGANSGARAYIQQHDTMSAKQLSSGPTALQRHQQATKKGLRIKSGEEITEIAKIQPSTGSSKRSGDHKDDHGQEMLQSVYEKRIIHSSAIHRQAMSSQRPITQPNQYRRDNLRSAFTNVTAGGAPSGGPDNYQTLFTPSDRSQLGMSAFDINQQQQWQQQQQHNIQNKIRLQSSVGRSGERNTSGIIRPTDRSSHSVHGRASIKTLIKVATSREN